MTEDYRHEPPTERLLWLLLDEDTKMIELSKVPASGQVQVSVGDETETLHPREAHALADNYEQRLKEINVWGSKQTEQVVKTLHTYAEELEPDTRTEWNI